MLTNAGTLDDAGAGGLTIFETAQVRWLNVEEIIALLSPEKTAGFPLQISTSPPSSPPSSGQLFLYDRSAVRNYKVDGHVWIKKRNNPNKVREDHVKLRFQGQYRVSGTYVHSATVSTTHRRAYRLITEPGAAASVGGYPGDQPADGSNPNLVLVHYLDTLEAVRVSALYADHLAAAASKNRKKAHKKSTSSSSAGAKAKPPVAAITAPSPGAYAFQSGQGSQGSYQMEDSNDFEDEEVDDDDDDDDEIHPDHILAAIGGKSGGGGGPGHGRDESLDEGALDILWDMVLEEGGEDVESDVQDAAAKALEQHMPATLEAQLVNTVEEVIQDVATSTLNEHMTAVSDDDIRQAVEQVLNETDLKPEMEEKVLDKIEEKLPDDIQAKLVETIKTQLEGGDEEDENEDGTDNDAIEVEEVTDQDVVFAKHVKAPLPIEHGDHVPQTPLPEIIDFTPAEAMRGTGKPTYCVISTSAAIPMLPPDDLPYRWHIIAAFIDIGKVAEFQQEFGAAAAAVPEDPHPSPDSTPSHFSAAPFSPDPLIMKVALANVRKLTPFSYKCEIPQDFSKSGGRSIILVGIRYIDADAGPLWDAIRVAVKVCIQAEWSVASDLNTSKTTMAGGLVRPKFFAPAGSGNVQLLSQLSQEEFEINECPTVSMTPAQAASVTGGKSFGKSSSSEVSETKDLPAPASTMATVASALTTFAAEPPPTALGTTIPASSSRHKRALSIDAPGQLRAANKSAANWVTSVVPNSDDRTRGEEVDRHCKIRFVERLANVIVGTEDEKMSSSKKTATGDVASTGYSDPGFFLSGDSKLKDIDDEELDALLNSVLIRFVESMVDSCVSEDELKEALNARGFSGFTLLHYAALYNILSLIPLLLSRGADPNVASAKGKLTPLHLASGAGHDQIVDALVRYGCNIDAEDSFGLTPADHATRAGFVEIAEWLLDRQRGVGNSSPKNTPACSDSDKVYEYSEKDEMMQSAFKELSLKDKLGLNLFVQRYKLGDKEGYDDNQAVIDEGGMVDDGSAVSDDDIDFGFITEKDRDSLKIAMSLMSKEELEELEKNAPYSNVRDWMIRSNYESLRDASIQLEKQAKRKVISNKTDSSESRSTGTGSRNKEFSHSKLSQVLAMLVLRKNLLGDSAKRAGQSEDQNDQEMGSAES